MSSPRLRRMPIGARPRSRGIRRPSLIATGPHRKARGRRECRVKASPMARLQQRKQAAVTTGQAEHPAFPARWAYELYVISPGTGSFVPVSRQRGMRVALGASTGAPGPHDFAVRNSISRRATAPDKPRPPHPRPTYRDDRAYAPSLEAGWVE